MATQMPQFDKLNGADNFKMWKLQMCAFLDVHGLADIVNGHEQCPGSGEDKIKIWKKSDAQAKLAILCAVSTSQLEFISSAAKSCEMWANLMAVYEQIDETSKLNALKEYHRYTYDGSSMAVHLAKIENLAKHCGDSKKPLATTTSWPRC